MAIKFAGVATTDNYSTGVLQVLNGNITALAQMLDPSYATYTDTPTTGAKRISSGLFQQYASGSWSELSMGYVKKAGDTGLTGAQVWSGSGSAAPTFTTRSAGAKVVLWPAIDATHADYALGIGTSALWYGVPSTSDSHKWYAGTTLLATLSGAGVLNAVGGLQVNGSAVWHAGNLAPSSYAPLASPALTGNPTAPKQAVDNNTARLATTEWFFGQVAVNTPAMNGSANAGGSTRWARDDHVHPTDTSRAPLASPALTGTPTSTTPTAGDNSTRIATTAFVQAAVTQRYESAWTASLPAVGASASFTHGLGAAPMRITLVAECTTADGEFVVGDRVHPEAFGNNNYTVSHPYYATATAVVVTTMAGGWVTVSRTTMGGWYAAVLTPGSWKYKVIAEL